MYRSKQNLFELYRFFLIYEEHIDENQINIDTVYAIHLYAKLESGKLAINEGPVMACNMPFHITIEGKGGHGSRPDLATSPLMPLSIFIRDSVRCV